MIAEFISDVFGGAARAASAVAPRSFTNATPENPQYSLNDPRLWDLLGGGSKSDSGIDVNHRSALSLAPVWNAVDLISCDVAKLPMDVYKRLPGDDREVAMDHEAEFLISDEPNEEMCAFEFWRRAMVHSLLWQNAYIYVHREGNSPRGKLLGLYNLLPDRTKPMRLSNGNLFFQTYADGRPYPLLAFEVMHLKGLSIDNESGYDLVCAARDSFGLALAAQGFSAKFFANGAQAAGILTVPPGTGETAMQNLEKGLQARTGKDHWFKTMILRDGAEFHSTTVDPQKSQMHELREDQVRDVSRFFKLPPSKLGLPGSVSYNSAEQAGLDYLASCISPHLAGIAGESRRKLLTLEQRRKSTHYIEHNVSKLIEIDVKTMNEVLAIQRQNEFINSNEARRKLNLNKRTDPGGEVYSNPNTKSAGESRDGATEPVKPAEKQQGASNALGAMRGVLVDAVSRATRRVAFDARSQSKKPVAFLTWLDDGAVKHRNVVDECLRAPLIAWCAVAGGDADPLLCDLSGRFFAAVLDELRPLVDPPHKAEQLFDNVDAACRRLEADLPQLLTNQLTGDITCRAAA